MRAHYARLWGFRRGEFVSHLRILWFRACIWPGSTWGVWARKQRVSLQLGRLELGLEFPLPTTLPEGRRLPWL